jgi:capsular exopolysaccharide synthesis family protein
MNQELGIKEYFAIVLKRRWILIISVISAIFLFIGNMVFRPAVYQSSAMLMIELQKTDLNSYSRYRSANMLETEEAKPLEYYQSVLYSRALRSELIRRLQADDSLWAKLSMRRDELRRIAMTPISLTPSPGYEDFVMLTVSSNNPLLSYRLAVNATNLLKEQCQTLDREELQNAVNFIEQQKEAGRRNLDEAERTLQEFKKKTNLTLARDGSGALKTLSDMEEKLTAIETEKQFAAANLAAYTRRLAQMESNGPAEAGDLGSPQVVRFKEEIASLESQRSEMTGLSHPDNPEVKAIDDRIETKKRELITQLLKSSKLEGNQGGDAGMSLWKEVYERKLTEELNHFVLENRERYYRNLIDDFKRRNPNLMENAIELMRLTRSQTVSENLYTFLLQQGEEAKIKAAAGTGGIRIIDMPVMPSAPVPVNAKRKLAMYLLLGAGLGFGVIMLQEMLDHSMRSPEDVSEYMQLPVLGQIPLFPSMVGFSKAAIRKSLERSKLQKLLVWDRKDLRIPEEGELHPERFIISHFKPKDPVVEAYRSLRSNLQFASIDHPIRTLMLSSPNPSEGKTVTVANLGIVLALQGSSVCVVDADLRKPKQHTVFKLKQHPGLTECLIDNTPVMNLVQPSGIDKLWVLTSGKIPPNPAEVLGSRKMQEVIAELSERFDFTIFDTPPVLAVTDPVILSSRLDGVILVIKHESTNRQAAAEMVSSLKKANGRLYGVVINQVVRRRGYGYYYSDKKYY